jgi:uncharacterized protein YaaQ
MVMAVVPRDEAESVLQALVAGGFTATFTDSRGGMLRQAQQMLFIAVKKEGLEEVLAVIRDSCHSHVRVEAEPSEEDISPSPSVSVATRVGGAVVFIWDINRCETF